MLSWEERIANYAEVTGFPAAMDMGPDGVVFGIWVMGQNYTVKSGYYGGYPAGYLKRIAALFPDKLNTLHLFSGKVDTATFPGDTVDSNPEMNPTFLDDAHTMSKVPLETAYDLVLADPPYSVEDCEHYGTTMVKRNKVMESLKRLPEDAHVVWLDQVLPMYSKAHFDVEARIGMVKSTNHRFRVITIFRRTNAL